MLILLNKTIYKLIKVYINERKKNFPTHFRKKATDLKRKSRTAKSFTSAEYQKHLHRDKKKKKKKKKKVTFFTAELSIQNLLKYFNL